GQRREPDRERADLSTGESPDRRGGELDHRLAIEVGRRAAVDQQDPPRADLRVAAGSRENRLEPLAPELAEVDQRGQLLARPAVELAEGTGECRLAEDGHDEDVGLDVPRLIGGDAYLHERPPWTWWRASGLPGGECTSRGRNGSRPSGQGNAALPGRRAPIRLDRFPGRAARARLAGRARLS